ncbi:hypothetical protein [Moorena sp. SIO3H5]|uniref:hypothetical protein n=1 Tax=Moorena sp. SIO3H5 TaxID=2607834 RepID=UPI0013BD437B|nr:hypothetical protein [Moorena sp. SIO3H5]NEO69651.1 hypothetical protein [Moorena sp. SIO3H5]
MTRWVERALGGMGILVEWASWWNGHLSGMGILPVTIFGRTVPTLATEKMRASLLVVRYGADYRKADYEAKNQRLSARNAPYCRGTAKIVQ